MVICLERGADLHTAQLTLLPLAVSCFGKIQIDLTFLVQAQPGSPGKRAAKRVCVCECVCVCVCLCHYTEELPAAKCKRHPRSATAQKPTQFARRNKSMRARERHMSQLVLHAENDRNQFTPCHEQDAAVKSATNAGNEFKR